LAAAEQSKSEQQLKEIDQDQHQYYLVLRQLHELKVSSIELVFLATSYSLNQLHIITSSALTQSSTQTGQTSFYHTWLQPA